MYNLTNFAFLMYFATKPPFERVCDIFYMHDKFYMIALSSKQYTYFKEPPMKGYHITVTVYIFRDFFNNFNHIQNLFSMIEDKMICLISIYWRLFRNLENLQYQ